MRFRRRSLPYRFEEVVAEFLRRLNYEVFLIDAHPSPDIVAIGRGRILLVEVKLSDKIGERQVSFLLEFSRALSNVSNVRVLPCVAYYDDGRIIIESLLDGSILHVFEYII